MVLDSKQSTLEPAALKGAVLAALHAGLSETDPRLVKLLGASLSELGDEPRLRKVRKAIRTHNKDEEPPPQDTAAWPHRDQTGAWRVVLLGGDRRHKLRQKLLDTFGFDDVRWVTGRKVRKNAQTCQRIRDGKVDLCLMVTRFLAHKASIPVSEACKDKAVPIIHLNGGNGVELVWESLAAQLSA